MVKSLFATLSMDFFFNYFVESHLFDSCSRLISSTVLGS